MIAGFRIYGITFSWIFEDTFGLVLLGLIIFSWVIATMHICFRKHCCEPPRCFEWEDSELTIEQPRTFQGLFKNKAYFEIIECIEYRTLSFEASWVVLYTLFFFV